MSQLCSTQLCPSDLSQAGSIGTGFGRRHRHPVPSDQCQSEADPRLPGGRHQEAAGAGREQVRTDRQIVRRRRDRRLEEKETPSNRKTSQVDAQHCNSNILDDKPSRALVHLNLLHSHSISSASRTPPAGSSGAVPPFPAGEKRERRERRWSDEDKTGDDRIERSKREPYLFQGERPAPIEPTRGRRP